MSTEGPVHENEADRPLIELIGRAGDDHRPPPGWQARVRARIATEGRAPAGGWWRRVAIGMAAASVMLGVMAVWLGATLVWERGEERREAELRAVMEFQREMEIARRDREFQLQIDNLLAEIDANQAAQDKALEEIRASKSEEARRAAESRYAELRIRGEATKARMASAKKKKEEDDKKVANKCANSDDPLCGLK